MQKPGDEIKRHLNERGWTQEDLARILDRPLSNINWVITGKTAITPKTAIDLGAAFGIDPEEWLRLEAKYRLSLAQSDSEIVGRRARLYDYAPIKDMEKRRWIPHTTSPEEQERVLCQFYEIDSLEDEPQISVATRRTIEGIALTASQKAWCFRAKKLARAIQVSPFKKNKLEEASLRLRDLAAYPEEARHVSKILAQYGIRYLVIEPLSGAKIDGATLWLDEKSPVIVMSLRYDRIDAFWFTLLHEFSHIVHEDASVDDNLCGKGQVPSIAKIQSERRADIEASERLVPSSILTSFIVRTSPLYSKKRIIQLAHRVKIHPGIIVGQLQHMGEIGYSANREMLAKIRDIVLDAVLTDGWGRSIELDII